MLRFEELDFFDEENIFKQEFVGKFVIDVKFIDGFLLFELEDGSLWEVKTRGSKVYVKHYPCGMS